MTKTELNEILELHKKWLNGDADGERANLQGANLQYTHLCGADLRSAYLQGVNLRGASLQNVNLQDADLHDAYLRSAFLWDANLQNTNFWGADLQNADLREANLRSANLQYTNLQDADLYNADLQNADLYGAKNVPDLPWTSIVPECGSFIGWKKVGGYIIKLKIPDNAKRSNATGRKCRCSAAEVLEIQNLDGTKAKIHKIYNNNLCGADYIIGETVIPDCFDDNRWNECSYGIHFFITRQEAVEY